VKKSEKPRLYGQNKLFSKQIGLQILGGISGMPACRSSSKNTVKMSFIPVFNTTSSWAHTETELDVFGVYRKLVKYVVHLSKRK
jgi:hypothetical protein